MKKVFQFLSKSKAIPGDVGIEIECEGKKIQVLDGKYWKTEQDGSLRGRFPDEASEFVLKKPIDVKEVIPAMEELINHQKDAKLDFGYRTSVHVHVNVQDLTSDELMNFIYTYLLLEEPLVNFCGRERKGNRFCLRVQDAEGFVFTLADVFRQGVPAAIRLDENSIRYSSLNIASLRKYGSIEFRAMRGNMDAELINIWCNSLVSLREFSKQFKEPKDVVRAFLDHDPKDFMKEALGEWYSYYTYPRMVKEIQRSYSLSLDLPFAFKSYKEPEKPVYDDVGTAFWEFKVRHGIERRGNEGQPNYPKVRIHNGAVQLIERGRAAAWLGWRMLDQFSPEDQAELAVFDEHFRTFRTPARVRVE